MGRPGDGLDPFAGLQHTANHGESLCIYGLPVTIPLVEYVLDEGAELVELRHHDSDVLVDRYDCRLLLDPSELDAYVSRAAATDALGKDDANERLLDEERYRDVLQKASESAENYSEARQQQGGGGLYSAVPLSYDGLPAVRLEDLLPPPPPPPPRTGSVPTASDRARSQRPFFLVQWAILQRVAKFHRHFGELGLTALKERCAEDIDFAFLHPNHLWHDFFLGMGSRLQHVDGVREPNHEAEERGHLLAGLIAGYGSDSDAQAAESALDEAQIRAIIGRFIATVERVDPADVNHFVQQLSGRPAFPFLQSKNSDGFALFKEMILNAMGDERGGAFLAAVACNEVGAASDDAGTSVVVEMEATPKLIQAAPQILSAELNTAQVSPRIQDRMHPSKPNEVPGTSSTAAVLKMQDRGAKAAEVDEATKTERLQKIKKLMERRKRAEEEKKREQQAVRQRAEAERRRHLDAISKHKQMFLNDD